MHVSAMCKVNVKEIHNVHTVILVIQGVGEFNLWVEYGMMEKLL